MVWHSHKSQIPPILPKKRILRPDVKFLTFGVNTVTFAGSFNCIFVFFGVRRQICGFFLEYSLQADFI
jgi:hypothetical protein